MKYTRAVQSHWATPLLGLMTAYFYFTGAITHPAWWLLIIFSVVLGHVKK
jgi:hypothetical protein